MRIIKRFIIILMVFDNVIMQALKRLFPKRYQILGSCKKCGQCCKEILLECSKGQIESPFFLNIAIRWLSWLYDFKLIYIYKENRFLAFTCKKIGNHGKCGDYFWRPPLCRNYPISDYFKKPVFLEQCGFYCK